MEDFTLLYVEDNKIIQKIVKVILKSSFREIYIANDGEEGIKLYKEKNPDIILADISMPNMDGFGMINEIKKLNPYQKIALLTAYNTTKYLNKAINIGIDKYILKPINPNQMMNALNDIINLLKIEREQKKAKMDLEIALQYDELTGLLNRKLFYQKAEKLITESTQSNKQVAILSIDLNLFKNINDTYGHDAGDAVLKRVAKNLLHSLRKDDIVARFGGDEFAVAIGFLKKHSHILSLLKRVEESFMEPLIYIDNNSKYHIPISLSIGITFYSKQSNNISIKNLLKQSDKAMYLAKNSKKMYKFFDENEESSLEKKEKKAQEINRAINQNEFIVYYQPIIDIKSNKVVAFASLVRWKHPQKGVLTPDSFLPYILDNPKIVCELGKSVIENVFKQFEIWKERKYNFLVSINISYQEFTSKNFIPMLKELLKEYPLVNPNKIVFELTEDIALKDIETKNGSISQIKSLGFKIALDNFGTGYSTLSCINKFRIDSIKIDKKFVMSMLKNQDDHSIVNASIQLAKVFGYRVIAEGVESKEHLPVLLELGCDRAQGYGIAKPMPPEEIELFLKEQ
ncbi:MAG: GGDEF domain-containing response regulator [Epsilonproteobacteria bacterium]|nr:GGDEF domain-containing response regulator [Campylobacterota bacterium]